MHRTDRPPTTPARAVAEASPADATATAVEAAGGELVPRSPRPAKRERQRRILELVRHDRVASQHELVEQLAARGIDVTQATISRDIAELGLVKVQIDGVTAYAPARGLTRTPAGASDERLRRVLADYPVRLGRSALTLLVISEAATAQAIAEAIDESTLDGPEGTIAGDDTVLVLFADETRLDRWRARFEALLADAQATR